MLRLRRSRYSSTVRRPDEWLGQLLDAVLHRVHQRGVRTRVGDEGGVAVDSCGLGSRAEAQLTERHRRRTTSRSSENRRGPADGACPPWNRTDATSRRRYEPGRSRCRPPCRREHATLVWYSPIWVTAPSGMTSPVHSSTVIPKQVGGRSGGGERRAGSSTVGGTFTSSFGGEGGWGVGASGGGGWLAIRSGPDTVDPLPVPAFGTAPAGRFAALLDGGTAVGGDGAAGGAAPGTSSSAGSAGVATPSSAPSSAASSSTTSSASSTASSSVVSPSAPATSVSASVSASGGGSAACPAVDASVCSVPASDVGIVSEARGSTSAPSSARSGEHLRTALRRCSSSGAPGARQPAITVALRRMVPRRCIRPT